MTRIAMESGAQEKKGPAGLSFGRLAWRRFRRDRLAVAGALFIILLIALAASAPLVVAHITHHPPYQQHMMDTIRIDSQPVEVVDDNGLPVGPNRIFLLGADLTGRDVLSRIIYGARVSLLVAILATGVSLLIGLVWGTVAAFYGGLVDTVLSRIMELMMAFPILLLAIALASAMQSSSLAVVILIIGFVNWTYVARIVRGQVLSLRQREFGPRPGRRRRAHHVSRHPAQPGGPPDRLWHSGRGRQYSLRDGPQFPGPGGPAAHAQLGQHDPRGHGLL